MMAGAWWWKSNPLVVCPATTWVPRYWGWTYGDQPPLPSHTHTLAAYSLMAFSFLSPCFLSFLSPFFLSFTLRETFKAAQCADTANMCQQDPSTHPLQNRAYLEEIFGPVLLCVKVACTTVHLTILRG